MKRLVVLAALALPVVAQAQEMEAAPGGTLRFLDKITGKVADLPLSRGQSMKEGHLTIQLDECRFPKANPAADAQAHVTVLDDRNTEPVFAGWMMASSPALSAMDHPRYDVWVLSCDSGFVAPEATDPVEEETDTPEEVINEG